MKGKERVKELKTQRDESQSSGPSPFCDVTQRFSHSHIIGFEEIFYSSLSFDANSLKTMTTNAITRILETFKLDAKLPWTETLSVTYPETIEADVEDDLNRERGAVREDFSALTVFERRVSLFLVFQFFVIIAITV